MMKKEIEKQIVNGYEIIRNDYWNTWQVWHPEIGFCGEFNHLPDAIDYCNNG